MVWPAAYQAEVVGPNPSCNVYIIMLRCVQFTLKFTMHTSAEQLHDVCEVLKPHWDPPAEQPQEARVQ